MPQPRFQISILAVVTICTQMLSSGVSQADPTVRSPQFVVTDQNGTLVGALASVGTRVSGGGTNWVRVLRRDTTNNENYTFFVGVNFLEGIDDDDVWYSNNDCTGTAYVQAPSNFSDLAGLRGSVFVIGRKAGATDEDSLILRGSGAGADNSASMMSRYRTRQDAGPTCNTGGSVFPTTSPTVVATQVDDLSGLTRPFKVE